MPSPPPAIRATGLRKHYGDVKALDGLDLEVREGTVFGLLGPNGAGKTTTVKVLTTLERADHGEARVLSFDVAREPSKVRAAIGYVPQELSADRYLTAREGLDFFARLYHLGGDARKKRVGELLELVGLAEAADRQVRTYSGGMKKKLDLACGLIHEPRVLFLDEPTLGLDVESRRAVWEHVAALRARGTTVILCTNDMAEADRLCDEIAILDRGKVVTQGTPVDLRAGLGGDVVVVEPQDPARVDAAERALAGLDFVRESWREGQALHVGVARNETALPLLLDALKKADVAVASVAYRRPDLAEVFVKHAGRRFAEADREGIPKPATRRK